VTTAKWIEKGESLVARINELIQHCRALGENAARDGDRETAWFADKQIADLEKHKAKTQATIDTARAGEGKK
jgi:DNA-binding ferritin-like protein